MRTDHDRLRDILDRAERIARHTRMAGSEDLVLDAVLHNLVVIGEAVRGLSACCRSSPAARRARRFPIVGGSGVMLCLR